MATWILSNIPFLTVLTVLIGIITFIFFLRDRVYRLKISVSQKLNSFYMAATTYSGETREYSHESPYWCLTARNTGAKKIMIESVGLLYRRQYTHAIHKEKTQLEPGAKVEVPLNKEIIASILTDAGNNPAPVVIPIVVSQTGKTFKGKKFPLNSLEPEANKLPGSEAPTDVLFHATFDHPGQDKEGRIIPQKRKIR